MAYKYIFFDLDGTLTDPAEGITNSVAHALKYYGITAEDKRELYKFIGPPLYKSFMDFYGFSEEKAKEAVEHYREYFGDRGIFENRVFEGIPALLERLCQKGYTLCLATSKPEVYAVRIMKKFGLAQYFKFIGGSLLSGERTDKGEVIRYVMHAVSAKPEEALMVGDRLHDIKGAKKNGVKSIGVLFGFGSEEELTAAGADYLAATVEDVEKIITGM